MPIIAVLAPSDVRNLEMAVLTPVLNAMYRACDVSRMLSVGPHIKHEIHLLIGEAKSVV